MNDKLNPKTAPAMNWNAAMLQLLCEQSGAAPCPQHTSEAVRSLLIHVQQIYATETAEEWSAEAGTSHPAAAVAAARYFNSVESLAAAMGEAFQRVQDLHTDWKSLAANLAEDAAGEGCVCPMCADDTDIGPIN